jgi:hypothetical protein
MNYLMLTAVLVAGYFMFSQSPLNPNEKSFTLYYWSNCSHCKRMMPDFNKLGLSVNGAKIRKVERSFNTEYQVSSFPTIVYRDGNGGLEIYDGGRD